MPKKIENPELHVDLMFPSKYLKASDFDGKPVRLTIASVRSDQVQTTGGKVQKFIVSFRETDKELILNKTNAKAIAKALEQPKAILWAGQAITLKPARCEAFGDVVDCIRVEV